MKKENLQHSLILMETMKISLRIQIKTGWEISGVKATIKIIIKDQTMI
jgi:ribosomal protein L30E